jgi:mono/diheme cytochrome c family protein
MQKFALGFVTAVVVVVLAGYICIRFGLMDSRADIPVSTFEQKLAMPSLDASVDRRAPEVKNPVESNDVNLIAGMKIYQANCSNCHGDIGHPRGMFADALYPRAPQFMEDAPDMPESQNFYIIQHGIRMSGMPAWKQSLSEQQMWQVTAFLNHMDKLPPHVSTAWKTEAGASQINDSSHDGSKMEMKDMKNMDMPIH